MDNALDPALELYHPDGTLVAFDDNSAGDGRNAWLTYTVPADGTGTWVARVLSASDSGEYEVRVTGHSGADPAIMVVHTEPPDGSATNVAPDPYVVEFSVGVYWPSVDATDLVITPPVGSPVPADAVALLGGASLGFDITTALSAGDGWYTVDLASSALNDLQFSGNLPYTGTFRLDTTGPRVVSSTVQEGELLVAPTSITVGFDEPLDTSVLDQSDVTLVETGFGLGPVPLTSFVYDPVTDQLTLGFDAPLEGLYTLTLKSAPGRSSSKFVRSRKSAYSAFTIKSSGWMSGERGTRVCTSVT